MGFILQLTKLHLMKFAWPESTNFYRPNLQLANFRRWLFKRMGQPRPLFLYSRSFQTQILHKKTVGLRGIRTRIVGVEGEHVDHLATSTTQLGDHFN